jgi:hypothetical protein
MVSIPISRQKNLSIGVYGTLQEAVAGRDKCFADQKQQSIPEFSRNTFGNFEAYA